MEKRAFDSATRRKMGRGFDDLEPDEVDYAFDAAREDQEIKRVQRGRVQPIDLALWQDIGTAVVDLTQTNPAGHEDIAWWNVMKNERAQPGSVFEVLHHTGQGKITVNPDEVTYYGQAVDDLQSIYTGMVHAKRNNWQGVEVGEDDPRDFKLKTWCAAQKQGLEVTNFKPGWRDRSKVRAIMTELDYHVTEKANAAQALDEKFTGPDRPNTTGPGVTQKPAPA